jgi:SAM-dependent methyltransferase
VTTNRDVFDHIAASWYGFRHWPLLRDELNEVAERWGSGRLIDLGCGHGADLLPFAGNFRLMGLDFSREMLRNSLRYAHKHGVDAGVVQGDLTALPIESSSFDFAVAVASYHHIEGHIGHLRAFGELRRVLKQGGEVFLSVWNHGQPRFRDGPQDLRVPWQSGNKRLERYYHLFDYDEIRQVLEDSGLEVLWLRPERRHADDAAVTSQNICVLARKND